MLVWNAIESITPMMSAILPDELWMPCMVCTTCATTSPPCAATPLALVASSLARAALSAFWRTVAVICSIDAAVSSRALAWLSVRAARSVLPCAICALAVATPSAPWRTRPTTSVSWRRICNSAAIRRPISLLPWAMSLPDRSPRATARASSTACATGCVMERTKTSISTVAPASVPSSASACHASVARRRSMRACRASSTPCMAWAFSAYSASMVRV